MSGTYSKLFAALLGVTLSAGAWAQAPQLQRPAVANFKTCAKPHYPRADLRAEHQGTVTLKFQIGTDGKVTDSIIGKSSGYPALDEEARSALASCQFQPAIGADGQPVPTWVPIQYVWSLK